MVTIIMHFIISFLMYLITSMVWGVVSSKNAYAHDVTLRDKIGQMFVIGFNGQIVNETSSIVQDIEQYNLGGVILFDYNYQTKTFGKNIVSREQVTRLNQTLQQANEVAQRQHGRPDLPLLIAVDYEGGLVNRLKEQYGFPSTLSASDIAKLPVSEAKLYAANMANTLKASGFNLNFSPVLDVNVNPENPILGKKGRTYSEDPFIVTEYAGLFSEADVNQRVQCAFKHFPGHGSSTSDSHLGFVDVSSTWRSYELEPYYQLLNQANGCGMVMTAHIVNRQLDKTAFPATLSHAILTDLLRNTLHFEGVVVSDDMQMKAITDNYGTEDAVVLAINSGVDMLIFGSQLADGPSLKELIDLVDHNVQTGEISKERIEDAYQRIVRLKKSI